MEKLKKIFNVSLKFVGSFIIAYLVCVMIDAFCLCSFVVIAHVISGFSLTRLIFGVFLAYLACYLVFNASFFLMKVFSLYSNKSKIAALFLITYGLFGFYNYWEPILTGELENVSLAEYVVMAQNDAGRYYTLGAWVSVVFAFIFNAIIWFLIWAYSVDEN